MAAVAETVGGKRKASDSAEEAAGVPKRIKALDTEVVNKIAAGEIIIAPVHALKELIENAVDAGSTSIEIVAKEGGLKLLQITDNGHGIEKEDLSILCERFTTSKLKTFEDLSEIATYGFRGEALASISHIAHLAVTTRTKASDCAWRASYADGKLLAAKSGQSAEPRPIAGRVGTQITVEDIFYNMPSRQKAFRSPSEEYAKILDVVSRYAVHREHIAFACKKLGDPCTSISTSANSDTVETIRQVYGSAIANELIHFNTVDPVLGFNAQGWLTNPNYHVKKTTLLLFINHRSVESTSIKKALDQTYAQYLPKGDHPFVYLSLEIEPQRVDVNVHPTKREVNFLNEEEIIEALCEELRSTLAAVDASRTFEAKILAPQPMTLKEAWSAQPQEKTNNTVTPVRPAENSLVRTDPQSRKITTMLSSITGATGRGQQYECTARARTECRLTTIKHLKADVQDKIHTGLNEVFTSHIYAGLVDPSRRIVAVQAGVRLFLVDYGLMASELFYQISLCDFGNFGTIKFKTPLSLRALIALAAKQAAADSDQIDFDEVPDLVVQQLISKRAMLKEYFNVVISADGELDAIPLLLRDYTPSLAKLPRFLMRLGPCVDWTQEQACFESFLQELALFYIPEQLPTESEGARRDEIAYTLEHVLFPAFKTRLIATERLLPGVVEVANLKGLYKVFERC